MMSSAVRPLAVARGGLCRRNGQPEEVTTDGRCAGNATKLHGIEAVRKGGSCAMTWRKKLSDELSVRNLSPAVLFTGPCPGAPTERRDGAGPGRDLRGGGTSPALCVP